MFHKVHQQQQVSKKILNDLQREGNQVSYSSIDPITANSSRSNLSQLFSSTSTGLMLLNAKDQPGIKPNK